MSNGTSATQSPEAAGTQPQAAGPADPYRSYNFRLDLGTGQAAAHFTQCSGLGIRIDNIEYREAGNNQIVRKLPGRVHYGEVTLRYGLTDSKDVWDWLMNTVKGRVERRNVSIILLSPDGTESSPSLRWNLGDAWPSEWRGAELDALGSEAAIASITLAFNSIELA